MVRQRHPPGAYQRDTHLLSPIDYGQPSDRLYGSEMDLEAVTVVDLGAGSVTDGAIAPGGLDGGTLIRAGTLPPAAIDTTPPPLPSSITVTSELLPQGDGTNVVAIVVTMVPPIDPETLDYGWPDDYFGTYVYTTNESDNDPITPAPVWTRPIITLIGKDVDVAVVTGVPGSTQHWVYVRTVDQFGNYSAPSATYPVMTLGDTVAPDIPQGVNGAGGFKGIGVRWDASGEPDLMHYEVRYAPGLPGGGPNTDAWVTVRTRSNTLGIDDLLPGIYYAQVRAIDYSRNVMTSEADHTAVNYLTAPEAGWSVDTGPMEAVLVGGSDVYFNEVLANIIETGMLDASTIQTGVISVSTEDGPYVDGIQILYGTDKRVIGKWDEKGLDIRSKTVDRRLLDYLHLDDGQLVIYKDGSPTSAINKDGVNATAINFGVSPGGHNLVFNSSFELSDFVATSVTTLGTGGSSFATGGGGWVMGPDTNASRTATAITMAAL